MVVVFNTISRPFMQDADDLKNRADNLKVPDAKVYDDVKDAEKKFKNYEDQADKNARVVKNATKMANESKTVAKSVMEIIKEVRYQIIELDSMIADIPDLDEEKLIELERKIKEQEAKEKELEASVKIAREKKVKIDAQIEGYYIDLSKLQEALVELTKNHEKLHKVCVRERVDPN
jgi:chromosome segregation ATPase